MFWFGHRVTVFACANQHGYTKVLREEGTYIFSLVMQKRQYHGVVWFLWGAECSLQNEWTNGNCNRDTEATHCDKVTGGHIPESVSSISFSSLFMCGPHCRNLFEQGRVFLQITSKTYSLAFVHMVMNRRIARMVLSTILRDIIMKIVKNNRTLILSNNNFRFKKKRQKLRGAFGLPLYQLQTK